MGTCSHGYPSPFSDPDRPCPYNDDVDGATVTDLHEADHFQISGRGEVKIVKPPIANKKAIVGRIVNIDGLAYKVKAYESCLINRHDEGHCTHPATGLLVEPVG